MPPLSEEDLRMAVPTVVTIQPQYGSSVQRCTWQTGLMDCCADCGVCCCGMFCFPCLACQVAGDMNECCLCGTSVAMRTLYRTRYNIPVTDCLEGPDPVLAMAAQPVITVQPQFSVAQQPGHWQTGLMDCCSDCGVCLCGSFCLPCLSCQVAGDMNECCLCGSSVAMRTKYRTRYNIPAVLWRCSKEPGAASPEPGGEAQGPDPSKECQGTQELQQGLLKVFDARSDFNSCIFQLQITVLTALLLRREMADDQPRLYVQMAEDQPHLYTQMAEDQPHLYVQMPELGTNGVPSERQSPPELACRAGSVLTFHNICYRVRTKTGHLCFRKTAEKEVLRDVNGIMKPGLNAILGPTGSGKSSLLDILAARKDPYGLSGDILINGAPQPANFKCTSGYVVQDDVVMGTLTVRENLQFSAALRLPKSVKEKEKNERVNQVIKELGLSKVADSKVGTQFTRGVSGGERKRTNIGMEIITDPAILFLDEPTTGLDASTANAVLLLLKRMSKQGRTIIFSIHQPRYSIFRLFDSLTLLAAGRVLYHGPAQNAIQYFQSIGYQCEPYNNPADFFLDVINGDSTAVAMNKADGNKTAESTEEHSDKNLAEQLAEKYSNSDYYRETKAQLEKISPGNKKKNKGLFRQITYANSFLHQLKWVSRRTFKNLIGNPQASIAQLCVTAFLGLIVGAIFFGLEENRAGLQNRVGAMFFLTTNQCFSSVSAIELFVVEKKIFIHEYISGYYRTSAYFIAKLMADLIPIRTMPSIIFTCIVYFMLGKCGLLQSHSTPLHNSPWRVHLIDVYAHLDISIKPCTGLKPTVGAFFTMMFTLMMVSYTATSMALAIAAGQSVVAVANLLMTVVFVFMIIFSGLLVNLTSVMSWLSWLKYLSIPRYGMTALQINELVGLNFCGSNNTVITNQSAYQQRDEIICTGEDYLKSQGIDWSTWGLWQNHVALACMTLIFLTIAYLKLHFMKKFS
ncbi:ATP-binding cassette sub-family G member 2 [Turdus rufiventris]|nr:ATP-binding cassette sub-family G member 2 [Turdus rufiventris]